MADICWSYIENELGIKEGGQPEPIIHEIAHAYDCLGAAAFHYVGSQVKVGNLVRNTYETAALRNEAEVRASAITYKVLANLGVEYDSEEIIDSMITNLEVAGLKSNWLRRSDSEAWIDKFRQALDDSRVVKAAEDIVSFVVGFSTPPPAK